MATKLHQILALHKTIRAQTEGDVTRAYHDARRTPQFAGMTRVYSPHDAEGETLPSERKTVQVTAEQIIERAVTAWTRQADIIATKDATNQIAKADVIVGGTVLLESVPVTTLLYLEKLLQNARELILTLPVLDPEVDWGNNPDAATGLWKATPEKTVRTKKVPRAFVKYPATEKHAAQVDTFTEDVIVGDWTRTLYSGALPAGRRQALINRVQLLAEAVKLAREYANQTTVVDKRVGATLFAHLFTGGE